MARQTKTPVTFKRSVRGDAGVTMSSAKAGKVVPIGYVPLLAGDSASGRVQVDIKLKEMPKPLLNGVTANIQAWFVPKSAYPQFSGRDELMHARTGEAIKTLGAADRTPPPYYTMLTAAQVDSIRTSKFMETLGIHLPANATMHTDLIDAFTLVYNFRLAANSSKIARRAYAQEDLSQATNAPRAFWPSQRRARMVPDYEQELVIGALDLDVLAGQLPVHGLFVGNSDTTSAATASTFKGSDGALNAGGEDLYTVNPSTGDTFGMLADAANGFPQVWAEMTGQTIPVSLADIDKARTTQAFAKLMTAYAGNDATGFDNEDTLVAHLMQGLSIPDEQFKRPWLLDSKRVPVGFAERFATDAANLDASVTLGRAQAMLSLNVPQQDVGGIIVFTCEVMPERIDERQCDEWLLAQSADDLPNALRDVQRVEPVDMVLNRRIDAAHTTPGGLYGYEPMNDKWNREFTRLGGDFFMATPGGGWTENRSNIWQTEIVDPSFNSQHYLAPSALPHDVFSDTLGDAFEFVARHAVKIVGLTQIGDVLAEDNSEYVTVEATQ